MSNNSDNVYNEGQEKIDEVQEKVERAVKEKAKKAVKKVVKKVAKKIGKAIVMALKKLIALLAPYLGIILAILLVCGLSYYFLFEIRGSEQQYSLVSQYENTNKKNDKGYGVTEKYSKENREIQAFYKYFSARSYYKLLDKDKKLTSLDVKGENIDDNEKKFNEVVDFYKKEDQFYLNQDLLYSLDELMGQKEAKTILRFPEQFIKPVYFDVDSLAIKKLTDDKGAIVSDSVEYGKDGKKTGKKVKGIWDYGLASVLHYYEDKEVYTVEGTYTEEDVWDADSKSVKKQSISEDYNLVMKDYPKKIYLMDKAITFAGDFKFKYKTTKEMKSPLSDGESSDARDPVTKVLVGEVEGHKLYKYRGGAVYQEVPREDGVETTNSGDKYYRDYLYNYDIYMPQTVMREFDFKKRTGSSLEDVEQQYGNIDYGNAVEVGAEANDSNDSFTKAKSFMPLIQKYCAKYGITDPWMIVAMITQESGGNPHLNEDGLMQVTGHQRCGILASGQKECITATDAQKQDPNINIEMGIMEYQTTLRHYNGDVMKALQGYNFGEGGMDYIKEHHPESWNSTDWLKYREESRLHFGGTDSKSADDRDPAKKGWKIYGDTHYVEHIMKAYAGTGDYKNVIPGTGSSVPTESDGLLGDLIKQFKKEFLKLFHEDYMEDDPRKEYKNFARPDEADAILKLTLAFKNKTLFSETDDVHALNFWDENFASMFMSNRFLGGKGPDGQGVLDGVPPELIGYVSPLAISNPVITSHFGHRDAPVAGASTNHQATDIGVPEGTPVYASNDGKVEVANKDASDACGKYIKLKHANGVETVYCHLSEVDVNTGDSVKKSQKIGLSGNTGHSSGPHLHFAVKINGTPVDGEPIVLGYAKNATASGGTGKGAEIVAYAKKFLGVKYVWGGETPAGFDCSGFVQYVYAKFGYNIPRNTVDEQNWSGGRFVKREELQPGDLIFGDDPAHHVMMYIGNQQFIHAPRTGDVIKITNLADRHDISPTRGYMRILK